MLVLGFLRFFRWPFRFGFIIINAQLFTTQPRLSCPGYTGRSPELTHQAKFHYTVVFFALPQCQPTF